MAHAEDEHARRDHDCADCNGRQIRARPGEIEDGSGGSRALGGFGGVAGRSARRVDG